jgi:hypothetical protein
MITKEQAIYNLARASLDSKSAWAIYLECMGDNAFDTRGHHVKLRPRMRVLCQAYVDCGVVTWAEISTAWFHNAKIVLATDPNKPLQ